MRGKWQPRDRELFADPGGLRSKRTITRTVAWTVGDQCADAARSRSVLRVWESARYHLDWPKALLWRRTSKFGIYVLWTREGMPRTAVELAVRGRECPDTSAFPQGSLPTEMYRRPSRSETLLSVETVDLIEQRLGKNWAAISAARTTTNELLSELASALEDLGDPNYSIVVTGSLGRGEATRDSDADWFLLVDGPSNPDHAGLARAVAARISKIVPTPVGPTGTFGEIVVSHDLIHYMAGTRDSNENLTRRILLLSESRALSNDIVRERVIRNILTRYVVYDRSVPSKSGKRSLVPHFLLNDVVRYWRTIASDYASKMWERNRAGWGMRNIKLRFSRKLLFLWGLIAAFSGELFPAPEVAAAGTDDEHFRLLAEHIRVQTDVPPLELLARVVEQAGDDAIADEIFTSYDHFLEVLSNPDSRKKLKAVRFEDAVTDETFDDLRETSRTFRKGVTSLFFNRHPELPRLIRDFGVF